MATISLYGALRQTIRKIAGWCNDAAALANELRTDHATFKAFVDEMITDHATFKTVVDEIKASLNGYVANGMLTSAALAIGGTKSAMANGLFLYTVAGVAYSKAAVAAGTALGTDVVPMGKFGCVALDIGADGTLDATSATGNATGYNTALLAAAGLPAVASGHVRTGYVTASKSDGSFTFGTTLLDAANSTVAYTSNAGVMTTITNSAPATLTATAPATLSAAAVDDFKDEEGTP